MIASLSIKLPKRVVTNDELRERHPDVVAGMEKHVLGRLWQPEPGSRSARFDAAAAPYLSDPFRGCVERRWLSADETLLDLEEAAAREALALAGGDVDLVLSTTLPASYVHAGDAVWLTKRLGLQCPAWNVESACSGGLVALQMAQALIDSGQHARVLVTVACSYSVMSPEDDTIGWGNGDAVGAFVVDKSGALLGAHGVNTQQTAGSIWYAVEDAEFVASGGSHEGHGGGWRLRTNAVAGRLLRETAEPYLMTCVDGALSKAGVEIKDIDVLICNTPTAWYTAFCADALGIAQTRCVNAHPLVANCGPALFPVNLHLGVHQGAVRPGALCLVYSVGSVSNASAAVIRCGEIRVA